MKKNLIKTIIKVVTFLAVLVLSLMLVFRVLWLVDDGYSVQVFRSYYQLPKNTVDAVFIGSSGARQYYNPAAGFHHNGVTCYALSTSNQSFTAAKYLIQEAEKTQDPSLYLIELRPITNPAIFEADIRKTTDSMKFSRNRLNLIDALLQQRTTVFPEESPNKWDYYFSVRKYHSRWDELSREDFDQTQAVLGHSLYLGIEPIDLSEVTYTDQITQVDPYNEGILDDLLEYCKGLDKKVVFVNMPAVLGDDRQSVVNYAGQKVEEAGFEYWDLNTPGTIERMGLDYSKDMLNLTHVNTYGALKFSDYFADLMQEEFSLPDRREDRRCRIWDTSYQRFREQLESSQIDERQIDFVTKYLSDQYNSNAPIHPDEAENLTSQAPDANAAANLNGKSYSIMAASISTFEGMLPEGYEAFYPHGDVTAVEDTWWGKLQEKTGMVLLKNASWSGSKISGEYENITGWVGCSPKRITDLHQIGEDGSITNPDIVLLALGANDMKDNVLLGEYYSGKAPSKELAATFFADAYNTTIAWIQAAMPDAIIVCCTYLPMNHPETGEPLVNEQGYSMDDYNNMVKRIAADHDLPCIDISGCGMTNENTDVYTQDGTHPNREGMELIASYLAQQLPVVLGE